MLGALLLAVTLVLGCGLLPALYWDQRVAVLGLLLAAAGGAAVAALVAARRSVRSAAAMF